MDFENMTTEQLLERRSAIGTEVDAENADLDALETEARAINAELERRRNAEAQRAEIRTAVADGAGETVRTFENNENREERETMPAIQTAEYRNAFYNYLANPSEETRTALINVDGNTAGSISPDAIAIPTTLDTMIWDNIHSAHPILADINTVRSGIMLEVTKHTAIAQRVTGKKDADAAPAAEDNTFVKVTLAGKDYDKYVELTYAEARMSQGALEQYLAQEIAAELGEALAKDVFAQIVADAGTGRKVTKSAWFADIAAALGKASHANNPVVYASVADYYGILGAVDSNGQPIFRDGLVLQATLKKDNAVPAGTVVVVDPAKFVLNEVQGVTIESDKDIKAHHIVVSGYLRAEGCMRDEAAAAYIA